MDLGPWEIAIIAVVILVLFGSAKLPQAARSLGLHLLGSVGPLRRLAMREGLAPSWRQAPFNETRSGRS